eukprot:CAMPEP_0198662784 /NCGR_PEP_ID=MMETSP1467-20131203/49168_1 /TAXON_ID=1462469 /ORGANISM="unid. sp., Strain CCMP2135" /LENGTH=75 /DNA_ID=CAMNT_0044399287 /DNA_START=44 /DNA_END=271 /DNA_ORIENTATION=-
MGVAQLRRDSDFLLSAERTAETAKHVALDRKKKPKPRVDLRRVAEREHARLLQMPVGMKRQHDNTSRVASGGGPR